MVGLGGSMILTYSYINVLIFYIFCINAYGFEISERFTVKNEYLKNFSSSLSSENIETKHFLVKEGTIEFWIKFGSLARKTNIPVFFWGEKAWKNSILMQLDSNNVFSARISSDNWHGQIQFSQRIALDKWNNIAFQWETIQGAISIEKTKLFINGKPVQNKKIFYDSKFLLGGKLSGSVPYYILIGAVRDKNGKIDKKTFPDMQISQIRISGIPRYGKTFAPEKILNNDKDTLLIVSSQKGKIEGIFRKNRNYKNIEIEKGEY